MSTDDEKALSSERFVFRFDISHSRADTLLILVLLGLSPGGTPSMNG